MGLGTASVCLSVLVLNFHHKGSSSRMPRWARVFFLHHCARAFGFINKVPPSPQRPRDFPNNFRLPDSDPDSPDNVEVRHILSPSARVRRAQERYVIKDSLNYHSVDLSQMTKKPKLKAQRTGASESKPQSEDIIKEWQMLARVLDRLFFIIVFLIILASALFLLLSPWYVGPKRFRT